MMSLALHVVVEWVAFAIAMIVGTGSEIFGNLYEEGIAALIDERLMIRKRKDWQTTPLFWTRTRNRWSCMEPNSDAGWVFGTVKRGWTCKICTPTFKLVNIRENSKSIQMRIFEMAYGELYIIRTVKIVLVQYNTFVGWGRNQLFLIGMKSHLLYVFFRGVFFIEYLL